MGKLQHQQTGFSIVEGLLILVAVGLISFVGWYVYYTHRHKQNNNTAVATQKTDIQEVDSLRPEKQKETEDLINKMDFGTGSLLAGSKVDVCQQIDTQQGFIPTGSIHDCYYRRKLFVGYKSSPSEIVSFMNNFALAIGFKSDGGPTTLGFESSTGGCYSLEGMTFYGIQYMTADVTIFDASVPIASQMCINQGQLDESHMAFWTPGTTPTYTINETVDESKVEKQAEDSGMKSLVFITITNPIDYY